MPQYAPYGNAIYGITAYGSPPPVSVQTTMTVSPIPTSGTPNIGLYDSLYINWVLPGSQWNQMILVRSSFAVPSSPFGNDGVQLLNQTSQYSTSFTDTGLQTGRFYYYALFVFDTLVNEWLMAASAQGLCLTDYGFENFFVAWTPDWYMEQDQLLNPPNPLRRFFGLLGFEMNWVRSEIETLFTLNSPEYISGAMLPYLGGNVGVGYEPALGMGLSRNLVSEAAQLYKTKGTFTGVQGAAAAYSGYGCTLNLSPNLEIQLDDATADRSIGHWVPQNVNTTLSQVSSATYAVVPQHANYLPIQGNTGLSTGLLTTAGANGYLPVNNEDMFLVSSANTFQWTQQPQATGLPGVTAGQVAPGTTSLSGYAMAYNQTNNTTVLFGGSTQLSAQNFPVVAGGTNQTWVFNGTYWTQLSPNTSPPARTNHSMAYDAVSGTIILFGGISPTGAYLSDTWSWNGTTWTQLFPVNSPGGRQSFAMAQWGSGVLLFGGTSQFTTFLNDTWQWNGTNWVQQLPVHSPSARNNHAMAYNGFEQATPRQIGNPTYLVQKGDVSSVPHGLLPPHSGSSAGVLSNNTAIGNTVVLCIATGGTSTNDVQSVTSPMFSSATRINSVANAGTLGITGGDIEMWVANVTGAGNSITVTTVSGTQWNALALEFYGTCTATTAGTTTGGSAGTTETQSFSGLTNGQVAIAAVQSFSLTSAPSSPWVDYSTGGGTLEWGNGGNDVAWQVTTGASSASATWGTTAGNAFTLSGLILSPSLTIANGVVVLFGGASNANFWLSDTWIWNGVDWQSPSVSTAPPGRSHHAMAYDIATDNIVIFGGSLFSGPGNDTWVWSAPVGGSGTWVQRTQSPNTPAGRQCHGMAYSPAGTLVMFAGGPTQAASNTAPPNDTWVFNAASSIWWQLDGTQTPMPRQAASICYNASTQTVQMFGGLAAGNYFLNTFWQWSQATGWQPILPANGVLPAFTSVAPMVYTVGGQVVLYGGENPANVFAPLASVWIWNGTSWTQKTSAAPPGNRAGHNMVWDTGVGKVIIFGGTNNGFASGALNDTWSYNIATNTFTNLAPANPPPARQNAAMTFTTGNSSILFGGLLASNTIDNRTWVYNSNANTWTPLAPTGQPPNRWNVVNGMVYDAATSQVVLMYGSGGGALNFGNLTDTWIYTVPGNNWSQNGTWTSPAFTGVAGPSPRQAQAAVYVPNLGSILAFGGVTPVSSVYMGDTYLGAPGGGQVYISECNSTNATTLGIPVQTSNSYMLSNIQPQGWWRLNETLPGPVYDSGAIGSSGGNGGLYGTGTIIGSVPGAVPIDSYYLFNGGGYVSIPNNENYQFGATASFIYGGFFNTTTTVTVGAPMVGMSTQNSAGASGNGTQGYSIDFFKGYPSAYLSDGGGGNFVQSSTGAGNWADGKWHFIVAVVDRIAGNLNLYIDGHLQSSTPLGALGSTANTNPLGIGGLGSGSGANPRFSGGIQEVFVAPLSQAQIASQAQLVSSLYSSLAGQTTPITQTMYVLSGYWQPVPAATPILESFTAQLDWYASNGALISSTVGNAVTEIAGSWVRPYVAASPPAGAAYIGRTFKSVSTSMTGDQHLFDAVQLEINTQATPGPTAWTPPRDLWLNLFPFARNLVVNGQGVLGTTGFDVGQFNTGHSTLTAVTTGPTPPSGPTWPAQVSRGFSVTTYLSSFNVETTFNSPSLLPVNPGQAYSASAWVQASTALLTYNIGCLLLVQINWYATTNANSFISTTSGPTMGPVPIGEANGNWIQVSCLDAIAPPGAQYAQMVIGGNVVGNGTVYIAAPCFGPGLNTTYFDGLFSPSPDYAFEGTPIISPSAWYPNVLTRLDRLVEVMPLYAPIGSTFSIYTHGNAWANVGLH